jgi:hypothetical protein
LFKELERAHIIVKHRGGIFRFGGENGVYVGRNEEQATEYIMDEKNKETVVAMQDALEKHKEGIAV